MKWRLHALHKCTAALRGTWCAMSVRAHTHLASPRHLRAQHWPKNMQHGSHSTHDHCTGTPALRHCCTATASVSSLCGYGCRTVQGNGTACRLLATVEKAAWQRRIAAALGIQPVQKTWPFGGPHFVSGVRTQNCLRVDSKLHGLRAAILDFFGKRSSAMWSAFRGRGNFSILQLLLILFDGRISGPGGGRKSAAASWPLVFSLAQGLCAAAQCCCAAAHNRQNLALTCFRWPPRSHSKALRISTAARH